MKQVLFLRWSGRRIQTVRFLSRSAIRAPWLLRISQSKCGAPLSAPQTLLQWATQTIITATLTAMPQATHAKRTSRALICGVFPWICCVSLDPSFLTPPSPSFSLSRLTWCLQNPRLSEQQGCAVCTSDQAETEAPSVTGDVKQQPPKDNAPNSLQVGVPSP